MRSKEIFVKNSVVQKVTNDGQPAWIVQRNKKIVLFFENKLKNDLNRSNKIEQNRWKMNDTFEEEQNQLFILMYKPG